MSGSRIQQDNATIARQVDRVCRRIAPVWPLDSFVAVNPYLGLLDMPFAEAGEYLADTVGERLFMDRAWYAGQYDAGHIRGADLDAAAAQLGLDCDPAFLIAQLRRKPPARRPLVLLAQSLDRSDAPPVSEFVVEQIGRFLAAYFDRGQALWQRPVQTADKSLFTAWRQYTLIDRSADAAGLGAARRALLEVPESADAALAWALGGFELPQEAVEDVLFALIKSIGGWASWCRYRLWQAELRAETCNDLHDLLTLRLVWEALLLGTATAGQREQWRRSLGQWLMRAPRAPLESGLIDEVFVRAAEIAFRRQLAGSLNRHPPEQPGATRPAPSVQAAFCIDVRSEVFRRHLEASMPGLQTIGFAGFFGVPLEYRRIGEPTARTHTPVLLNPGYRAQEHGDAAVAGRRDQRLGRSAIWKQFKLSAASCFTFVEAAGLSYVPRLLADTLGWHQPSVAPDTAGLRGLDGEHLHPRLESLAGALGHTERVELAEGMLRGLGLTRDWADVVLLIGHGSSTTNNPHRAGLDCGACAGQTGEVSARVAADLLNDARVRTDLAGRGIEVRTDTRFVPALHDTTTDVVELLDPAGPQVLDAGLLERVSGALVQAGRLTRLERLVALDATVSGDRAAEKHVRQRARDWSQVRPEWALAGNAAFIAAPRWRTAGISLDGRAFLHDYDSARDPDFSVLRLIMTAPLIVANWINLQYYGSTVDNRRQGSGNKVLHNVVGGLVGVLEGNGGDLRVGLAEQSLHDGERLRHEPLRLSAFIEAPTTVMDEIIGGHDMLRNLVEHRWLLLHQIDDNGQVSERRADGAWEPVC